MRVLRAESPPVLYCPDAFGHPAALPELAAGFRPDVDRRLARLWRRALASLATPLDGAPRAAPRPCVSPSRARLGTSSEALSPTAPPRPTSGGSRLDAILAPRATLGVALLPNGADHHARQQRQREALSALAAAATSTEIVPSSLRAFADAVQEAARTRTLPAIEGELRDSYGYTWTLQGTLATRASQKRRNASLERMLVRDAEPWLALAPEGGRAGERALLHAAWRALLEGHPHDTLCGTSVDAVAHRARRAPRRCG
jgi:hypothetical protein